MLMKNKTGHCKTKTYRVIVGHVQLVLDTAGGRLEVEVVELEVDLLVLLGG